MYSYELLYGTLGNLVISQTLFCASIVTFILKYLVVSDICVNTLSSRPILKYSYARQYTTILPIMSMISVFQVKYSTFFYIDFIQQSNLWHSTERTSWQHG